MLEWNGVLLRGKTFEEVERIINATSGEIEIVVKDGAEGRPRPEAPLYDAAADDARRPPVPAHRAAGGCGGPGLGQLQLALGFDRLNGALLVTVLAARGLSGRGYGVLPNPFVKLYLLPGRK